MGAALAVALLLSEEWLQRKTGQPSWAISQLAWAVIFAMTAALLVVYGHPLAGLFAVGMAVVEIGLARLSWRKRRSAGVFDATQGGRASFRPLGVRGWTVIGAATGLASFLQYQGLAWSLALGLSAVFMIFLVRVLGPRRAVEMPSPPAVSRHPHNPGEFGRWPAVDDAGYVRQREFRSTLSGRSARVLGWALRRVFRPPSPPD